MTNKERYQRAFSPLHASGDFLTEVQPMMKTNHPTFRRALALCAAVITIFALATVCYAADVGGIQRKIQIWLQGEQTDAVLNISPDGSYSLNLESGKEIHGGGTSFNDDGSERPLTEDEILEHLNRPICETKEDGSRWLYYRDQAIEITDLFDEDGVCYVMLQDGDEILYCTIKKGNGMAVSPHSYISPDQFNIEKADAE